MKNFTIQSALLLTVSLLFSCGSGQEGIKLSGKIEQPIEDELVILSAFAENGLEPVDTIAVDESGEFEAYVKQDQPTFYRLNFYNRQMANLILNGDEEEIKISLEGDNPKGVVSIEGSKHTQYLQGIEGLIADHKQDVQDLNQEAITARMEGDQQRVQELTEDFYALSRKNHSQLKQYIWDVTPSLAAFYGLQSLNPQENMAFYDSISTRFNAELPNHHFTKDLAEQLGNARTLAIGSMAPEISLPDPDGEVITLSSLRGNYVLIDFWAAWCRPCRIENPNVVRLYNQYSDRNFEILGVSLDRKREDWVKAIDQDKLTWLHVSDLKYFNSEAAGIYKISAIPATYLIGPDGKIIAKNLRGASLEAKLKEIFG